MMHFPAVKLSKSKVQEERVVTVYSSLASKLKRKKKEELLFRPYTIRQENFKCSSSARSQTEDCRSCCTTATL